MRRRITALAGQRRPPPVIPKVPSAPKLRHSRSTHRPPNFVILRAVAESISPCQRTTQKTQRPLHTTMDTATSRSMTALVRRRCMRRRITALVRRRRPPPVIPKVPSALQTSSFCAQSQNPSPPANAPPRKPSALCTPTMDTATSRRITALVRQRRMRRADNGVGKATAPPAKSDNGVGRATAPSKLRHPQSTHRPPNFVILRAVAESISACQRTTQKTQRPLHTTMDTATSRSMTALVSQRRMQRRITALVRQRRPPPVIPKVPAAPKLRHPRSTHRTQTSSFCAQSQNPSPPANAPPRKSSALCTPPWILRLRAV